MKPHDIGQLATISALAPLDDEHVVAHVTRPDPVCDRVASTLVVLSGDGAARPLLPETADDVRDSAPVLSPDGRRVAFLRDGDRGAQAYVVDVEGGAPIALAELPLGALEISWSVDGSALIAVARRPEPGRYGTVADVAPEAEPPRRITSAGWRLEGVGYILDRPASLVRLELPRADRAEPAPPQWIAAPAGEYSHVRAARRAPSVYAIANAHPEWDDDLRRDLYEIDAAGVARNMTRAHGAFEVLSFAELEDGRIVFAARDMGPDGRDYAGAGAFLAILEGAHARVLTDAATDDVGAVGALLVSGATTVDVCARRRGASVLERIDVDSGVVTALATGPIAVTAHTVLPSGSSVWACTDPGSSALVGGLADAPFSPFPIAFGVHPLVERVVRAGDDYPVHGWVAVPAGEGPHPVVLAIHGGPYAQYGPALADEIQVLVSAGFAVVQCNPRGSAGYGRAHARAIRHRMGTDDAGDVLAFLDAALRADPRLDAGRTAVIGGSYGGFLTAWLLAHTQRFRAAVIERGWFDPAVFTGTSDIGRFYADEYVGRSEADIARQSPQALAHRVRTPSLIIHSERDLRCPIGQSERYYTTLRRQGVPVEFVVFPGEGHELTRSGRPRHRVQRFEILLEWLTRHLHGSASAPITGGDSE